MDSSNTTKYIIQRSLGDTTFFRGSFTSYAFRPHFHQTFTIILVTEGIGDYSYGLRKTILPAGSLIVYNPYEVHAGRPIQNNPWRFDTIYVPVAIMQKAMAKLSDCRGLPCFQPRVIHDLPLFIKGTNAFPEDVPGISFSRNRSNLMDFLIELIQKYAEKVIYSPTGNEYESLQKVKLFIHDHYKEGVSLNQLSNLIGCSEYTLIKKFKHYFNLPPNQYTINFKVEQAKKSLLPHSRLTDIAYEFGFFDQSHFIRHFKKINAITPKQYVRSIL